MSQVCAVLSPEGLGGGQRSLPRPHRDPRRRRPGRFRPFPLSPLGRLRFRSRRRRGRCCYRPRDGTTWRCMRSPSIATLATQRSMLGLAHQQSGARAGNLCRSGAGCRRTSPVSERQRRAFQFAATSSGPGAVGAIQTCCTREPFSSNTRHARGRASWIFAGDREMAVGLATRASAHGDAAAVGAGGRTARVGGGRPGWPARALHAVLLLSAPARAATEARSRVVRAASARVARGVYLISR
jgi:hypothetical protein